LSGFDLLAIILLEIGAFLYVRALDALGLSFGVLADTGSLRSPRRSLVAAALGHYLLAFASRLRSLYGPTLFLRQSLGFVELAFAAVFVASRDFTDGHSVLQSK
jgi:hypothetical protein